MEEIKNKIRQICTYHSELGEGTSGYNLSEKQFQKLFEIFEMQVKINTYLEPKIGDLRQWINEKPKDHLVTDEDIKVMLGITKLNKYE